MNQVLQRSVYELGTDAHAEFLAEISGMKGETKQLFLMLHDGCKEREICHELGVEHDAYVNIERMARAKLMLAVFECINYRMQNN